MRRLTDYRDFVPEPKISEIYKKASELSKQHIIQINGAYYGGGDVEVLRSITPLLNEVGVDVGWRAMVGSNDFYSVVKKLHNAIHGDDVELSDFEKDLYEAANSDFSSFTHLDHDLVVVHGLHPLPLLTYYRKNQPWVWRNHIDSSSPHPETWDYLKSFILSYDKSIFHMEEFVTEEFSKNYGIIKPSIDPLSSKNREMDEKEVEKHLEEVGLDSERPIITQVAQYDKHAHPRGVLRVFEKVREEIDCQLVMMGWVPSEDMEGQEIYENISRTAEEMEDVTVLMDAPDILVNAVQTASDVVVQRSEMEGFGLSVCESLWKETPVVGSEVGGIQAQIKDGENGYLVPPEDYELFAKKIMDLLSDEQLREEMGRKGKGHVRKKFLITRQINDWLDLYRELLDH